MKAEVRDAAIKCGRVPWNFARLLLESRGGLGFSSRSRKQVERDFLVVHPKTFSEVPAVSRS